MLTKKPQTQNKRNMTIHLHTNTVQKRSKSSIFGYKITKKRDKKKHISAKMKEMYKSVTRHYPITKESILGLKISD